MDDGLYGGDGNGVSISYSDVVADGVGGFSKLEWGSDIESWLPLIIELAAVPSGSTSRDYRLQLVLLGTSG